MWCNEKNEIYLETKVPMKKKKFQTGFFVVLNHPLHLAFIHASTSGQVGSYQPSWFAIKNISFHFKVYSIMLMPTSFSFPR